jgi:hypothetical protein
MLCHQQASKQRWNPGSYSLRNKENVLNDKERKYFKRANKKYLMYLLEARKVGMALSVRGNATEQNFVEIY